MLGQTGDTQKLCSNRFDQLLLVSRWCRVAVAGGPRSGPRPALCATLLPPRGREILGEGGGDPDRGDPSGHGSAMARAGPTGVC